MIYNYVYVGIINQLGGDFQQSGYLYELTSGIQWTPNRGVARIIQRGFSLARRRGLGAQNVAPRSRRIVNFNQIKYNDVCASTNLFNLVFQVAKCMVSNNS